MKEQWKTDELHNTPGKKKKKKVEFHFPVVFSIAAI